jgi:RNA polymerase sigma-70 factor (sigma-E family)
VGVERALAADGAAVALDPDALVADLFASEGRSLVRLASIFCDDRSAAEDLVQEAFIRLHRSAHRIRDPERAPAFLRSIVINLARDHNRRGLMSLRHRASMVQPAAVEHVERDALDASDRQLLDALRLLPDRQRSCLVLRYYLQLSEAETAETLGISKNSVKTHCRRGLAALERVVPDALMEGTA